MRRAMWLAVLVLASLVVSPRPAEADFWDWLQEFSGPGPFHARGPNLMFDICPQTTTDKNNAPVRFMRDFDVSTADKARTKTGVDSSQHVTCFFTDLRFFENRDDDNFGAKRVRLNVFEFGVSARLHRAVVVGFGGGAMQISTPDHTAWKGVFTGPRLVIKPLLLYGSNSFWAEHDKLYLVLGSIKYYVKENIVLGHLRGKDFGLPQGVANYDFDIQNDRVASTGFIIDATDLVALALRELAR